MTDVMKCKFCSDMFELQDKESFIAHLEDSNGHRIENLNPDAVSDFYSIVTITEKRTPDSLIMKAGSSLGHSAFNLGKKAIDKFLEKPKDASS